MPHKTLKSNFCLLYIPPLSPPPGHSVQALCKELQTCRSKTLTHVSLPRGLETDAGGYSEAYINRWSIAKRIETIMRHCDSMHSSDHKSSSAQLKRQASYSAQLKQGKHSDRVVMRISRTHT